MYRVEHMTGLDDCVYSWHAKVPDWGCYSNKQAQHIAT